MRNDFLSIPQVKFTLEEVCLNTKAPNWSECELK